MFESFPELKTDGAEPPALFRENYEWIRTLPDGPIGAYEESATENAEERNKIQAESQALTKT